MGDSWITEAQIYFTDVGIKFLKDNTQTTELVDISAGTRLWVLPDSVNISGIAY